MSDKQSLPKSQNVKKLEYVEVVGELNYLKGRVLTIIDSSITDNRQNKATKDLIHSEFGTTYNNFWKYVTGDFPFPMGLINPQD